VLGTDGSETCQCREGFTGAQCEIGNKLHIIKDKFV